MYAESYIFCFETVSYFSPPRDGLVCARTTRLMSLWFGDGAAEAPRRSLQGSVQVGPSGRSEGPYNSRTQQGIGRVSCGATYEPGEPRPPPKDELIRVPSRLLEPKCTAATAASSPVASNATQAVPVPSTSQPVRVTQTNLTASASSPALMKPASRPRAPASDNFLYHDEPIVSLPPSRIAYLGSPHFYPPPRTQPTPSDSPAGCTTVLLGQRHLETYSLSDKSGRPKMVYSGAGCYSGEVATDRGKLVIPNSNSSPTFMRAMMRYKETGDSRDLYNPAAREGPRASRY